MRTFFTILFVAVSLTVIVGASQPRRKDSEGSGVSPVLGFCACRTLRAKETPITPPKSPSTQLVVGNAFSILEFRGLKSSTAFPVRMPRRRFLNGDELREALDYITSDQVSENGDDDYLLDLEAREAGWDVSDDDSEEEMDLDSEPELEFADAVGDGAQDYMEGVYDDAWLKAFDERVGPLLRDPDDEATPYEIFSDFLTNDIIHAIVIETNRYADQYFQSKGGKENLSPNSRARKWKPVNAGDIKAAIGVILYTGLVKLPAYNLYWCNDALLNIGLKKTISRDRFLQILAFLHLADNDAAPQGDQADKLHKIRGVMNMFIETWGRNFGPKRELSVDETVIAFKGRSPMQRYNPQKPHKWGMVAWSLCDAATGYVLNWRIASGAEDRAENGDRGAMHATVYHVSREYQNKGHHLYMDNLFSSPALFRELASNDMGACGTLRTNRRGVPVQIHRNKPKKDEPALIVKEDMLTFISWADKRPVNVISSVHNGATFRKHVRSKHGENNRRTYIKPKAIEMYTRNMGGVDLADQMMWHSLNIHRSCKWWKKIFFALLEVCFCNTMIVVRALNRARPEGQRKRIDVNKTRLNVIRGLFEGYERSSRPGPRLVDHQPISRLTERHFVGINPKRDRSGKPCRLDCIVCSSRKEGEVRHRTSMVCNDCGNVPMCEFPCHRIYHTRKNFKVKCAPELHLPLFGHLVPEV